MQESRVCRFFCYSLGVHFVESVVRWIEKCTPIRWGKEWNMKINEQCLSCLVNQAVKTANLVNAENRGVIEKSLVCMKNRVK